MKNTLHLVMLLSIVLLPACKKELLETDPVKIILGKWEVLEYGVGDNLMTVKIPDGFHFFQEDSILLFFSYKENQYTAESKYWFADTLLCRSTFWEIEDHPNGGIEITRTHRYQFYGKNNKLRLVDTGPSFLDIQILKRKN